MPTQPVVQRDSNHSPVMTTQANLLRTALAALVLAYSSACAVLHPRPGASASYDVRAGMVLKGNEIRACDVRTAYDAIERLRPQFLRWTRGSEAGAGQLAVYIDQMRASGLERLRLIPAASVREIRLLRADEATLRYGSGNNAGALDVVTGPPGLE